MSRRTWVVTGAVAVLAMAGVGAAVATSSGSSAAAPSAHTTDAAATSSTSPTYTPPPPALKVLSVAHASATTAPSGLAAVTVTFSAPVADSVTPTLTPAFDGSWSRPTSTTAVFTPDAVPLPGQTFTVTVPAGTRDTAGGTLATASTTSWTTRAASPARLQQVLAEAGYLPLSFTPKVAEPTSLDARTASLYAPVAGTYAWKFTAPDGLADLYTGATSTLLTRGALLAFQADHHLTTDGSAGPQVFSALLTDALAGKVDTSPYTSVYVSKSRPETLTVFQDGKAVLKTPANTGVSRAQTPDGSWAVYYRTPSQTMSGTNPDGSHYSDPGVPWISYFFGGDAVHGFPRASYGSPQSVGCVELPIATAKTVYGLMGYGDIVTVAG